MDYQTGNTFAQGHNGHHIRTAFLPKLVWFIDTPTECVAKLNVLLASVALKDGGKKFVYCFQRRWQHILIITSCDI